MCLFVCPDSIKWSGVLKCFYNGDIILIKILIMVNKYADFEFTNLYYSYLLLSFTNRLKFKMNLETISQLCLWHNAQTNSLITIIDKLVNCNSQKLVI